ncbi:hypothetical protein MMC25_000168 [Agyrium rufum]|nr:hypothetical protein [Agyrium rufum]
MDNQAAPMTFKLPPVENQQNCPALFTRHVSHLRLPLQPLLSIQTGLAHPAFPSSILQYHLLTEEQLDDLAHYYHQRTPTALSMSYPAPIITRWHKEAGIEDKRRRFGRFLGLRGCDSPVESNEDDNAVSMAEEMERYVEGRIRRAIERDTEREMWMQKGFLG